MSSGPSFLYQFEQICNIKCIYIVKIRKYLNCSLLCLVIGSRCSYRYEPLGSLLGKEYFLHAYGPIYALSADVVASLVALRNNRLVLFPVSVPLMTSSYMYLNLL